MNRADRAIGAWYHIGDVGEFTVWAPFKANVELQIAHPLARKVAMEKDPLGYWRATVEGVEPGTRYWYTVDGSAPLPDPASGYQPDGVHQPSAIVDHASFGWTDDEWPGIEVASMIIYELHVGAFTPEGTFSAVESRLNDLRELGVNAIEIMPVSQFPGSRNWGYDGVHPFAAQNSYGGPDGLKHLVNECHREGFVVILDVVYNHLGPEGNYLSAFAPYFTDTYKTPWGQAVNFDGPYSDEVRRYFIDNALYWFEHYHLDALRLDAVHAIYDHSAGHFLAELSETVAHHFARGRPRYLIAESDLNDVKVIRPRIDGGEGIDAQWSDDFHHALYTLLTGEARNYYADFGHIDDLASALRDGYVYQGQYSKYRKRRHGNSSSDRPASQFIVCSQNHDQIGNRAMGERLSGLVTLDKQKIAATAVLLAPYIPLLFMGEEYAEPAPFLYFVSVGDEQLAMAIGKGRRAEHADEGIAPDPQSEATFLASKLNWELRTKEPHARLLAYYRALISLRTSIPALSTCSRTGLSVSCNSEQRVLWFTRSRQNTTVCCFVNFSEHRQTVSHELAVGRWEKLIDSASPQWLGPGSHLPEIIQTPGSSLTFEPMSTAVYQKGR